MIQGSSAIPLMSIEILDIGVAWAWLPDAHVVARKFNAHETTIYRLAAAS
jgi:hypothetical protein